MIGQRLEEKIERGDSSPFYMTTLTKHDNQTGSYVLDLDYVWVSNIYKKDLQALGAKILDSSLGGMIGALRTADWYFKISREDYRQITKKWKAQNLKNFSEKLTNGYFDKKRAWENLKRDLTENHGLISISFIMKKLRDMEETDDVIALKKQLSEYKYMNIDPKDVLETMDKLTRGEK